MERDAVAVDDTSVMSSIMDASRRRERRDVRILRLFTDGSEIKDRKTHKTLAVGWGFVVKDLSLEAPPLYQTVLRRSGAILDLRVGNNQRAELVAIHEGLRHVKTHIERLQQQQQQRCNDYGVETTEDIELDIYTDSDYSMKCITIWSKTWERNGWKSSKRQPVKHQDVIKPILALYRELSKMLNFNISIHHVRSHTNRTDQISQGNDEADQLATQAARQCLQ